MSDFAALYVEYQPSVFRFIYQAVRNRELAEDMTSEVFCKLLAANANGGGSTTHERGYIYQMARNILIDYWRHKQRCPIVHINDLAPEQFENQNEELLLERAFIAPDNLELQTEMASELQSAAAKLTANQHKVIALQFFGYSWTEIDEITNFGYGAAKALRHRAIVKLRKYLEDYQHERNCSRVYFGNRKR